MGVARPRRSDPCRSAPGPSVSKEFAVPGALSSERRCRTVATGSGVLALRSRMVCAPCCDCGPCVRLRRPVLHSPDRIGWSQKRGWTTPRERLLHHGGAVKKGDRGALRDDNSPRHPRWAKPVQKPRGQGLDGTRGQPAPEPPRQGPGSAVSERPQGFQGRLCPLGVVLRRQCAVGIAAISAVMPPLQ